MVAIEHRAKSSTTTTTTTINASVLSPTSSSLSSNSSATTTSSVPHLQQEQETLQQQQTQQQLQQQLHKELTTKLASKTTIASKMSEPTDSTTKPRPPQDDSGSKSAVSQRNVDVKLVKQSNVDATKQELTKKMLKLDLSGKELEEYSLKSPKSPIAARLPHQASLTSSVDVEDRKTLREALYQGIFHRHRRTIFAVGSFLRMLRSRNSSYNTIRSSSEGEDIDEVR